jgi:hypothetical protein
MGMQYESDKVAVGIQMQIQSSTEDVKRALLQKVLASQSFARANRLSALLSFICERSLSGCDASELIENQIGTQVFGRPAGYNPMEDNIVRSTVRLLRQRLHEYYQAEGKSDPIRIEIPKGRYIPEFVPVQVAQSDAKLGEDPEQVVEVPVAPSVAPDPMKKPRRAAFRWAAAAVAGLAGLAVLGRGRLREPEPISRFWSELLDLNRRTIIVASDTALVLAQDLAGQDVSVEDYFSGQWKAQILGQTANRWFEKSLVSRRYTGIVDTDFALKICRRKEAQGVAVSLRMCRELRLPDSHGANLIVLGAAHANPWIKLLDRDANFLVEHFQKEHGFIIRNRSPKPDESEQWRSKDPERVYGVISFLPRTDGEGHALLLQGASIAGTECAIKYVTEPDLFGSLWAKLAVPGSSVPHFEAVLETSSLGGNAAAAKIVAHRVIRA